MQFSIYIYQIKYFRTFWYFMSTWDIEDYSQKEKNGPLFYTELIIKFSIENLKYVQQSFPFSFKIKTVLKCSSIFFNLKKRKLVQLRLYSAQLNIVNNINFNLRKIYLERHWSCFFLFLSL